MEDILKKPRLLFPGFLVYRSTFKAKALFTTNLLNNSLAIIES